MRRHVALHFITTSKRSVSTFKLFINSDYSEHQLNERHRSQQNFPSSLLLGYLARFLAL